MPRILSLAQSHDWPKQADVLEKLKADMRKASNDRAKKRDEVKALRGNLGRQLQVCLHSSSCSVQRLMLLMGQVSHIA